MDFNKHGINLLHRAATGTKKTRTLIAPIGLVVFGVFTALFVFAEIFVDRLLGLPRLLPQDARFPVSIPLMVVSLAVTAWSAFHFLKVRGTPAPFNAPPKVVDTGPYWHVRNPMLAGVFLFLFGIGFCVNSVSLVFFFMLFLC
jgi:protein-S-isoprenylcysteine O-methyltransferase Ste14